jgi:hypothetical protein
VIIIALAGISERQERFAFLQELLGSYQSQELAHLNQRLGKIAHEDALTGIANSRTALIMPPNVNEILPNATKGHCHY